MTPGWRQSLERGLKFGARTGAAFNCVGASPESLLALIEVCQAATGALPRIITQLWPDDLTDSEVVIVALSLVGKTELNITRSRLQRNRLRACLWGRESDFENLAEDAPDFLSWVQATYFLERPGDVPSTALPPSNVEQAVPITALDSEALLEVIGLGAAVNAIGIVARRWQRYLDAAESARLQALRRLPLLVNWSALQGAPSEELSEDRHRLVEAFMAGLDARTANISKVSPSTLLRENLPNDLAMAATAQPPKTE